MTRITNFGRKRTFVAAGLYDDENASNKNHVQHTGQPSSSAPDTTLKKVRTRAPKPKRSEDHLVPDGEHESMMDGDASNVRLDDKADNTSSAGAQQYVKMRNTSLRRAKPLPGRASRSDVRRQKRIVERQVETTCFACREKGHRAADCPLTANHSGSGGREESRKKVVGICYRCGSTKHTLARCKKTHDECNPLPFACCFICSGKGHLASSCPQNKGKGIYPNGGCCKLCGDTTHLARNCGLRTDVAANKAVMFSFDPDGGADEDDFHAFNRRKAEVEKGEKNEIKVKRSLGIKAGIHSGIVKSFTPKSSKKVVFF